MALIINDPGRFAGLGQALGQGLGGALETLAKNKLENLNRQYQRQQFQQLFPEQADLLAMFSNQPQIQAQLIKDFAEQKGIQQQQMAEMQALDPQRLLEQGLPRKLVEQIAQVQDPKYKKLLLENYLKQQNKPIGFGEAFTAGLRNYGIPVPGESRLPGIGEESTREKNLEERAAKYYAKQKKAQGSEFLPTSIKRSVLPQEQEESPEVNPAPRSNVLQALGALYGKPGLALTGLLEGGLGFPGAVAALPEILTSAIGAAPENLAPYREQMQNKITEKTGIPKEILQKFEPKRPAGPKIPTPSDIRQLVTKPFAEVVGTEKFLPANEAEDAVTSVFQEAAPEVAGALTSGGAIPIAKGIGKGLARAFGANTLGWLAQDITGSEKVGNAVKIGTYLASSIFPARLNDSAKNRYDVWNEAIEGAKNKEIPIAHVDAQLQRIQKQVKGMDKYSPAAKFMEERLGALEDKVHLNPKGKQFINIDTLADLRRSQNDLWNDAVKAGAKKPYGELLSAEKDLMEQWAKSNGKSSAFKAFEQANEIHGALSEAEKMNSFMQELAKARSLSFGAGMLMGGMPAALKGLIVGGFGAKSLYTTMKRLLSVPAIRNEYGRLLKASAEHNSKVATVAAHRLDNLIKKVSPKLSQEER